MGDLRPWIGNPKFKIETTVCCGFGCFIFFAMTLLGTLVSFPATAECTAYLPTLKSNSVAVIDTVVDRVAAVVPVQFQLAGS